MKVKQLFEEEFGLFKSSGSSASRTQERIGTFSDKTQAKAKLKELKKSAKEGDSFEIRVLQQKKKMFDRSDNKNKKSTEENTPLLRLQQKKTQLKRELENVKDEAQADLYHTKIAEINKEIAKLK